MSPTQRSLSMLRKDGWEADIVERWVPGANIRRDLFHILDIVGLRGKETIGVQTTTYSNVSARAKKLAESPMLSKLRDANWRLEIHGWHKVGRLWQCRVVDVS